MADLQLTELPALATPATGDLLYIVDISDTTDDPAGSSKQITLEDALSLLSTDHGDLTGLNDSDDHTIYVYLSPAADARNVIQPAAATVKALVLKGAASQSDNLLELQNSAGTRLSAFSAGGALNVTRDPNAFGAGTYSTLVLGNLVSGETGGALFAIARYSAANVPFVGFTGWDNGSSQRILYFGGGGWGVPDATKIDFYIAPSYSETANTGVLQATFNQSNKFMLHKSLEILWDQSGAPSGTSTISLALYQEYASTTGALIIDNYNADPAVNAITNQVIVGHWTGAGTVTTGFGARQRFRLQSSTGASRDAGAITCHWGVATDGSREGILSLYGTDYGGDRLGLQITGDGTNTEIGFFAVTPVARPSAYTQTYATADKTHAALTSATLTDNSGGSATTTLAAITGGGASCEDATKDAIASLAAQANALRVDLEDLKQLVNAVIDDFQSLGLLQ